MRLVWLLIPFGLAATLHPWRGLTNGQALTFPFDRYPARASFSGRAEPVDLASDSAAQRFRTVLRAGARRGPNFAGAYAIVTWGCGTSCRQLAIVSARTGAVYFAPFTLEYDIHFRRRSELLVVDPYACGFTHDELAGPRWRQLYRWTGAAMLPIDSLRVPDGHRC